MYSYYIYGHPSVVADEWDLLEIKISSLIFNFAVLSDQDEISVLGKEVKNFHCRFSHCFKVAIILDYRRGRDELVVIEM